MKNINEINPSAILAELNKKVDLTTYDKLLQGRCILIDDQHDYELNDARLCFESVLIDDQDNFEANLELGYYYFSIDENIEKSEKYFKKALDLSRNSFIDAVIASSKLYGENSPKLGLKFLENALKVESDKLEVLREELKLNMVDQD